MPSDNKPLPEPMSVKFYDAIWYCQDTMSGYTIQILLLCFFCGISKMFVFSREVFTYNPRYVSMVSCANAVKYMKQIDWYT